MSFALAEKSQPVAVEGFALLELISGASVGLDVQQAPIYFILNY
jgi:hypothetical protein